MQPDIQVTGIKELQAALRRVDSDLPKELRKINKAAAETVAAAARAKSPQRSGALRKSIVARAEQRAASVKGGGARVPYFGFIDFGGAVGRNDSVVRPFISKGRIIYPAVAEKNDEIVDTYTRALNDLLRRADLQ